MGSALLGESGVAGANGATDAAPPTELAGESLIATGASTSRCDKEALGYPGAAQPTPFSANCSNSTSGGGRGWHGPEMWDKRRLRQEGRC